MPQNVLSILTFLPLVGAVILLFMKRPQDLPDDHGHEAHPHDAHSEEETSKPAKDPARTAICVAAMLFAVLPFLLSLGMFLQFDPGFTANMQGIGRHIQYIEDRSWISIGDMHIRYKMGVDGISILLILLTTFLMVLCVGYSCRTKARLKEFMVFLLLLEAGLIGVFCALDLILFYIFWEAMLIPMYFLIGIFGHERRIHAAIKFFLFTFAGSIFMLIAIVATYMIAGTFDILALSDPTNPAGSLLRNHDPRALMYLYSAFALAFMIKVPMFPFHTWLPDAHVEAPTAGSAILAGVMLKMGTYGFIRFCLPLFPVQAQQSAGLFITLAVIGIIYGSIVAAVQPDAKKLVAYSSVAHLGFVVLGIFSFNRIGLQGALIQNINHGISTPMLFFIVGMLYDRRHTREITQFGGLKMVVPFMATMLLLATLSSVAVPFFNGFVGEFTILQGSFLSSNGGMVTTALAATGMILSAVYMLWWFQRLMLGPINHAVNKHLPDLTRSEWLVLTPLVVMIFWIGLGSPYWTSKMEVPANSLSVAIGEKWDTSQPQGAILAGAKPVEHHEESATPEVKTEVQPSVTEPEPTTETVPIEPNKIKPEATLEPQGKANTPEGTLPNSSESKETSPNVTPPVNNNEEKRAEPNAEKLKPADDKKPKEGARRSTPHKIASSRRTEVSATWE